MDPISFTDILGWCALALVLTCIIIFACAIHEQYNKRRRKEQPDFPTLASPKGSCPETETKKLVVRGYDSPELLREDLWLLRLDHARHNIALLNMRVPPIETSLESGQSHEQRVAAMLAQYAGARCDN